MARTMFIQLDYDNGHFVLEQYAELDFYCATCLRQQSDTEPTSNNPSWTFIVLPAWNNSLVPSQPVVLRVGLLSCYMPETTVWYRANQ